LNGSSSRAAVISTLAELGADWNRYRSMYRRNVMISALQLNDNFSHCRIVDKDLGAGGVSRRDRSGRQERAQIRDRKKVVAQRIVISPGRIVKLDEVDERRPAVICDR
jgi:hypothetical protein